MEKAPSDKPYVQEDKFLNALAEAYRLQETIISTADFAIISTNQKGTITNFNKAAEDLLGYEANEVIGKFMPVIFHDLDEIIHRSDELSRELNVTVEPDFKALTAKAQFTGRPDKRNWTYIRKDSSRLNVELSVAPLLDESESLIGYLFIVTEAGSEQHLRVLTGSIEDVIFEVNEEGRYLNVWAKNEALLFLPKKELIGHTLSELYGPKFAKPFDEILRKVIQTGEPHNFEYKSLVAGDDRWFNAHYSLLDSSPPKRVTISIHDITDRKKAEFALKESEQRFRLLAENIPGVIYLCNNDKNYSMLYLNDKIMELTGYTKEEFLDGKIHFSHIFHPDDVNYIYSTVDNAILQKRSFHLTYRIKHKSGNWRWMEEYGIGVYDDQQLLWIEGFISDITKRKTAEEEILKISNENQRVFSNTLSLNAVVDFDGRLVKVNPAWEKILGWSQHKLQSSPYIHLVHPEDVERTLEATKSVMAGNDLISFENRYRHSNGSYRWLLWTSSADIKNKMIYASAVDITSRKSTEEELLYSKNSLESLMNKLQEQNRQLDEFAHIISHNLRSPVGNIQALLSFLNEGSSMDDFKLIFGKLKNVSKNLSETMNELMDTLRIKKNTKIEKVELRFKDILDKVVQSLEGNLIQCGAAVTYDFNRAPKITYPKTYLESIFQNLLSNAIKYRSTDRPLQIHFSSDYKGEATILKVQDNGLGIDMEKFGDKLFGMHKTFHDHEEARGVGLFLTKTQIETMGGNIHAESEVDKGTTFIIEF